MNQFYREPESSTAVATRTPEGASLAFLVLPWQELTHDPIILSVLDAGLARYLRQNKHTVPGAYQVACMACDLATLPLAPLVDATGKGWLVTFLDIASKNVTTILVWQPEGAALMQSYALSYEECQPLGAPLLLAFVVLLPPAFSQMPLSFHILNAAAAYWYQSNHGQMPSVFRVDSLKILDQDNRCLLAAPVGKGESWRALIHEGVQVADVLIWVQELPVPPLAQICP